MRLWRDRTIAPSQTRGGTTLIVLHSPEVSSTLSGRYRPVSPLLALLIFRIKVPPFQPCFSRETGDRTRIPEVSIARAVDTWVVLPVPG